MVVTTDFTSRNEFISSRLKFVEYFREFAKVKGTVKRKRNHDEREVEQGGS